ncbi:hypothetical protein ATG_07690 [Desulfurococcaceae archaeon AG1]|nr:hypothetical protein ATG_07690 [Desulfurococcaceae archaeon AG1]
MPQQDPSILVGGAKVPGYKRTPKNIDEYSGTNGLSKVIKTYTESSSFSFFECGSYTYFLMITLTKGRDRGS